MEEIRKNEESVKKKMAEKLAVKFG